MYINSSRLLFKVPAVHPRMRGVHKKAWLALAPAMGSSPHTRGTQNADGVELAEMRIIPAYAGYTDNNDVFLHVYIVHLKIPKICGHKIG